MGYVHLHIGRRLGAADTHDLPATATRATARLRLEVLETFRVPSPKSKILDGVAWLAASHARRSKM
jgi:hypothetical protein